MAPRSSTLPEALTESAREARKAFFCELCGKGYTRMNEFEAHEGSYDHQHRKRLKEMRQMTKDPAAAAKRAAEQARANEEAGIKAINLSSITSGASASSGAAKKKPVFKSTLQPQTAVALGLGQAKALTLGEGEDGDPSGAVENGWAGDAYDPRFVVGCEDPGCGVCKDGVGDLGPVVAETEA